MPNKVVEISKKTSKKSKSFKKRILIYTVIGLAFIAIVSSKAFNSIKLTTVKYTSLEISMKAKGLVVKDEQIIKAPFNGYVKYDCPDGYRVPKKYLVATVFKNKDTNIVKQKIDKINDKINDNIEYSSKNKLFKSDIDSINAKINTELLDLQEKVCSSSIDDIYNSKNTLSSLTKKRTDIAKNFGYNSYDVDTTSLVKEKSHYEHILDSSQYKVNSSSAGLISTKFDGYEDKLSLVNYKRLDADSVQEDISNYNDSSSDKTINNVAAGDPIFKIINNYSWNIVCVLDKKDTAMMENNSYVTILLNNNKNLETNAEVIDKKESNGKYIVTLQLSSMLEYVYNKRVLDFTIIKGRYTGFEVPKSSITHKYLVEWECPYNYKFAPQTGLKNNKLYFSNNNNNPLYGQIVNKIYDTKSIIYVFLIDKCDYKLSNNKLLKIENNNGTYNTADQKSRLINSTGVYISKIGITKYCPIDLLKVYNNAAIVRNLEDSSSKVKYYEKVVCQPDKVKNGELID